MWRRIGEGRTGFYKEDEPMVEGKLRVVETLDDVLSIGEEEAGKMIVLTSTAGATDFALILHKIRGIVCTTGGLTCHLAILARESRVPCLFGTKLASTGHLDGKAVRMVLNHLEGVLYIKDEEGNT